MKTVQDILKACDIKKSLLVLLAGVPKKRFSKMLEWYYSLYCLAMGAWYEDGVNDCILTDFRQSEYKDGRKVYSFYGRNPDTNGRIEDAKIDWNQAILGKTKIYVPDCIAERIDDELLCPMFLHQMYEHCTVDVQKSTNKLLFNHINSFPKEKKSNIPGCENMLEKQLHYVMNKAYINNAILEYKESKGNSFKWGALLKQYDWKSGIPGRIMYSQTGSKFLFQALQNGRLPQVYRCFRRLDNENPPDLLRIYKRLELLDSVYNDIELSDYLEVVNNGKRIIIENNVCCSRLPLIYIRDGHGNQSELGKAELSELLCMDIHVIDDKITTLEQVMALLVFYLEYPIRVKRVQRKFFVQSLLGMKEMLLATNEKVVEG